MLQKLILQSDMQYVYNGEFMALGLLVTLSGIETIMVYPPSF